jgi:hypothetical protein
MANQTSDISNIRTVTAIFSNKIAENPAKHPVSKNKLQSSNMNTTELNQDMARLFDSRDRGGQLRLI